ncbi:MAG: hypothetical protein U5L96_15260 [Owenweeksia sp.]|nr:hypothetical protein [Owenweeksia sp.]
MKKSYCNKGSASKPARWWLPPLLLAGLVLFMKGATAQQKPFFTSGTEFSFPYLGHPGRDTVFNGMRESNNAQLQITARQQTCIKIQVPFKGYDTTFSLRADSSTLVRLPDNQYREDSINHSGIRLQSNYPVQIVFATDVGSVDTTQATAINTPPPWDSVSTEATALTPIRQGHGIPAEPAQQ